MNPTPVKAAVRVAWVIAKLTSGGIGPVCRYAAEGVARNPGWFATVVSLHEPRGDRTDAITGVRYVALGLEAEGSSEFLRWLAANPQDIVITSDVSHIEASFPYIPKETLHVIQIHDNLRRYRDVAVRNQTWIDGVFCVARHIEAPLHASLRQVGFHGVCDTVHNGAAFPPLPSVCGGSGACRPSSGPLRLIFMGRLDPFKGIFDLVPILQRLNKMKVPACLTIVGGRQELLALRFRRHKLDHLVTWTGRVPHQDCYRLAAESDVFLMLSRKEPFGMVTIEAMSMGCVPLAYATPSGSTEIIEDGRSGLLVPLGDFTALAQSIQRLHENRGELFLLSQGAIARARTQFSEEVMAKKLCAFLQRVQTNSHSHPSDRKSGFPPAIKAQARSRLVNYKRISPVIREWLRNWVGSHPRLMYWLIKHWQQ